eukprot:TRINITY_DN22284_c0_g1_i1.p1 TRINITY_DN22284_c0_g1~~TRINITY_DN22284_c0_g1_i1.p1  ORF type:complete len:331 (-),score=71.61 TRINITY_DN22284_c0_g1_i1:174-1166(-)
MPSVTWHGQDGTAETEEGRVAVLSKLLFVNGAKKRKLADLGAPPERGSGGQVILRFSDQAWCDMKFDEQKQSDDFVKLVIEAIGKRFGTTLDGSDAAESPWDKAVRAAVARAQDLPFVSPFPANFEGDDKPGHVPKVVVDVCRAWEAVDSKREKSYADKIATLESQRKEEERRSSRLEERSRLADMKLGEAEAKVASLQKSTEFLNKEIASMKKWQATYERADPEKLLYLERELSEMRKRFKDNCQTPPKTAKPCRKQEQAEEKLAPADKAKVIAEFEAEPLRACADEERAALKKRLLLKWHPDKQPSSDHAALSKRVMQELQNLPCWQQ